jgi:hypothetical protein
MKITATVENAIGELRVKKTLTVELPNGQDLRKIKEVAQELLLQASGDEIIGLEEGYRYHA